MEVITLRNKVRNSSQIQKKACHCLQKVAEKATDRINSTAYASVPSMCGVYMAHQFSIDMNCDKYPGVSSSLKIYS
ncbi:unnamed protein product [Sphenostylis stenocarpa]|uniref:Uncharacterized protein n=1 Tax=Sphenostylis stenocarpa TaxID=92480 RepID=A0AA86RM08_9FABA|nr:unnamed protein product [Sphenostylis stenocarpa]